MFTPLREKYIKELKEMSIEFTEDLPTWREDGFMYRAAFANGYGISIVKHDGSYGREANKWEIAVLEKGKAEELKAYDLCYSTPITCDVIGWLTGPEVMDYARQIAELPAA